jgi:uncharacterized lipoprotein YbaY
MMRSILAKGVPRRALGKRGQFGSNVAARVGARTRSCPARLIGFGTLAVVMAVPVAAKEETISGSVTLSDAPSVPPGSVLRVTLHDLSAGIAKDASVAKGSFEGEGKTPIRFELSYNEDLIEPNRLYGLAAVITNSRGQALWETRVPVRVLTKGNLKSKVELVLRPSAKPKAPPEKTAFRVECGGMAFDVRLNEKVALLTGSDWKITLPRVETPEGKKYSDEGTTFTVFGDAIYLQRPERAYRDCQIKP